MTEKRQFIVRVNGEITDEVRELLTLDGKSPDTPVNEWISPLPERGEARWLEPSLDIQGTPFFRVLATAHTKEEAKARVEELFSAIPHLSVGEAYPRPRAEVTEGDYEVIMKRAIEHFVVELMTGFAAEQERLYRIVHGRDEPTLITSVSLRGSYPKTRLRIMTYDRPRDLERPYEARLWSDQEFVKASRTIDGLERWIGDFLMYRRG